MLTLACVAAVARVSGRCITFTRGVRRQNVGWQRKEFWKGLRVEAKHHEGLMKGRAFITG